MGVLGAKPKKAKPAGTGNPQIRRLRAQEVIWEADSSRPLLLLPEATVILFNLSSLPLTRCP